MNKKVFVSLVVAFVVGFSVFSLIPTKKVKADNITFDVYADWSFLNIYYNISNMYCFLPVQKFLIDPSRINVDPMSGDYISSMNYIKIYPITDINTLEGEYLYSSSSFNIASCSSIYSSCNILLSTTSFSSFD